MSLLFPTGVNETQCTIYFRLVSYGFYHFLGFNDLGVSHVQYLQYANGEIGIGIVNQFFKHFTNNAAGY